MPSEPALFEIVSDPRCRLLRVTLRGYWHEDEMARYTRAVSGEVERMVKTVGCAAILLEMIDFKIQSQPIAAAHAALLAKVVKMLPEVRVALVMQSGLSKLQIARVAASGGHRTFGSADDALGWLLEVPAQAA